MTQNFTPVHTFSSTYLGSVNSMVPVESFPPFQCDLNKLHHAHFSEIFGNKMEGLIDFVRVTSFGKAYFLVGLAIISAGVE